MVGITSYGAYIPRYRLNRKTIFSAMGWFNSATAGVARGEKAVANYDEDSVTMAVAAAQDCLKGCVRDEIGGLYLSSTTAPYLERQNAAICAAALALRPDIRTADFGASLKSGTTALIAACDAVKAGDIKNFLVCAADSRQGKPGSNMEHTFGDGAAALIVGKDDVIAELKGSHSITSDIIDYRRTQEEKFIRGWEERWIRDEGYGKIIPRAVNGLLEKHGLKIGDFAKVVISCPVSGALKGICKKAGIAPTQLQDNLMNSVGDTGSALSLMMLVAALEKAKPGDRILVVGYGNGGDALFFEVTDQIEKAKDRIGIKGHLEQKKELDNYSKYLVYRDLIPVEIGIRGEEAPPVRLSLMHREGKTLTALMGSRCKVCGTPQYPKQRVCINPDCGAIDQMEDYYFYDKIGHVKSFTADRLAFSIDPPAMYGLIDFDEGGRLYLDITDCDPDSLKVGMPVRMSLRRRYADKRRGIYAYFWKAVPVLEKNV
ncbi:MAG: hydroxymethylglutaryl-CoA synthase [Deltaproteobacteria bacterium]|nr:MAG: hydroxymethylglutaryl-CoA synthase [Deltaproteobacteria bacterium]